MGEEELPNGDASLCINHARDLDNSHKLGTSFMDGCNEFIKPVAYKPDCSKHYRTLRLSVY